MHLNGHFQNAYVTRSLERSLHGLQERYGVREGIIRFDPDMSVASPAGPREMKLRVALIWLDTVQMEIIEPLSGDVGCYTDYLPADPSDAGLRLHHVCVRREKLDEMQREIDGSGMPRVFEASHPDGHFVYVDARADLGHYLEFAWATPEGWAMQGWPAGWRAG